MNPRVSPNVERGAGNEALRLLAEGRVGELTNLLEHFDGDPIVRDLLAADCRTRTFRIDLPELQQLQARLAAETDNDPLCRWWTTAMIAERLLVDGDTAGVEAAVSMLPELPTDAVLPVAVLYTRARLLRVAAFQYLVASEQRSPDAGRARDAAINDLLRCGFRAEAAATRGLAAGLLAVFRSEDFRESLDLIISARALLPEGGVSIWTPVLDYLVATLAFEIGDMTTTFESIDRVDGNAHGLGFLQAAPLFVYAFADVIATEASPRSLEDLERSLDALRLHHPRMLQSVQAMVAHTLADFGSPSARPFALAALDLPAANRADAHHHALLRMRIACLDGEAPAVGDAQDLVQKVARAGRPRFAGRYALRLGHDFARAGELADARALHEWGLERVPEGSRRTFWEEVWARPISEISAGAAGRERWQTTELLGRISRPPRTPGSVKMSERRSDPPSEREAPATDPMTADPIASNPATTARSPVGLAARGTESAPRPPVQICVLTPALAVSVTDQAIVMRATVARLLLSLVIAHPAPVNVEQVCAQLWPDASLEVGRGRLNTVVHRLRTSLPGAGPVVCRTGDLLVLDAADCAIDLLHYRIQLRAGTEARAEAISSVRGNLCHVQFPYDERLVEDRHQFVAEWLHHGRALLRVGAVETDDLAPAMSALGLSPADL